MLKARRLKGDGRRPSCAAFSVSELEILGKIEDERMFRCPRVRSMYGPIFKAAAIGSQPSSAKAANPTGHLSRALNLASRLDAIAQLWCWM